MNEELEFFKSEITKLDPSIEETQIEKIAMSLIKQRWIKGKDGEWKYRNGIGSTLSKEDFFTLQIETLLEKEKPDFKEQQEAAIAAFREYPYNFQIVGRLDITDEISSPSFLNIAKNDKSNFKNLRPNDYIILKSILCTSLPFVNANGDAFKPEDLSEAVESGQLDKLQPAIVDWRHDFKMYGMTIGAKIINEELEIQGIGKHNVKQIIVYSLFMAWLYPFEAKKIRQWAEKGILGFSMACSAESVSWLNGTAVRVLEKPHFVANSIIPPDADPADDNARLIEIAEKEEKDVPIIYASYDQVPKNLTCAWYKPDKINKSVNNTGEDMNEQELKELQEKLKNLEKANQELKIENDSLKQTEANKKIEELTGEVTELDKIKKDLEGQVTVLTEKVESAERARKEAEENLAKIKDQLIELRKGEVERINADRKEKIKERIGDIEDKINYWLELYKASVDEEGNIVNNEEDFNKAMNMMPEKEEKIDSEKLEDDKQKIEDVEESDKVKKSKEKTIIATKTNKEDKKIFDSVLVQEKK